MIAYNENSISGPAPAFPISVRIPKACRLTGIGRSKFFELIDEGKVVTVKIGSMTLVLTENLRRLLDAART